MRLGFCVVGTWLLCPVGPPDGPLFPGRRLLWCLMMPNLPLSHLILPRPLLRPFHPLMTLGQIRADDQPWLCMAVACSARHPRADPATLDNLSSLAARADSRDECPLSWQPRDSEPETKA
jgi:hypothetical protein